MKIQYVCPHWGSAHLSAKDFISKLSEQGYQGVEINFASDKAFNQSFMAEIDKIRAENADFVLIPQHILSPQNETIEAFIARIKKLFVELAALEPQFINSHTGKDYFSFDDNCRILEAYSNLSEQTGVPVYHEIHRGRFSFHAPTLVPYLEKFPQLALVGDYSHFCVVSESLLEGQEAFIAQIVPHIKHLHARIGSEQASQVSDPAAPEWQNHLQRYLGWWQQILDYQKNSEATRFTITPEFGPAPYMPALPFTQQAIGNQWNINLFMKNYLIQHLV